jgi:hypothetical protein
MFPFTSAAESVKDFSDTVREVFLSGAKRYADIFRFQAVARAVEFLTFAAIHTYLFLPLACRWFKLQQPIQEVSIIIGIAWAIIIYPACYLKEGSSDASRLDSKSFLKSRLIALVLSWVVLVIVPVYFLYSLRWILIPLVIIRLALAYALR